MITKFRCGGRDIHCHLATAHCSDAKEAWAVLTNIPPSLQTFSLYGQRFGGIEPHFKDYKLRCVRPELLPWLLIFDQNCESSDSYQYFVTFIVEGGNYPALNDPTFSRSAWGIFELT